MSKLAVYTGPYVSSVPVVGLLGTKTVSGIPGLTTGYGRSFSGPVSLPMKKLPAQSKPTRISTNTLDAPFPVETPEPADEEFSVPRPEESNASKMFFKIVNIFIV